jgi:hypothetical protein
MYIENFDKIYGQVLYTSDTMFEFTKDSMIVAPHSSYTLRLKPVSGTTKHDFTLVITVLENRIKCGIYIDGKWEALEIFDMSRMDLKTIETFKRLVAQKIQNHE